MHAEAWAWLTDHATDGSVSVLDLGGRVVNWDSPRVLFPNASSYTVLDVLPAEGVDIVADAATWNPNGRRYDVAVAAELFEHAPEWPAICRTAFTALVPGGRFIVTTAAPGRPPHSGIDGMALRFGEYYANITGEELRAALEAAGFRDIEIDMQPQPADVRAVAVK
jgi:methyltransferase family protein